MALGLPASVTTATGTTTAVTTSAFTVTAGSTIYVGVFSQSGVAVPSALTISSTPSLTWAAVGNNTYDTTADGGTIRMRFQVWRATSTGASTTVTITPGATLPGFFGIQVQSISGASDYIGNVGWATNAAGDPAPSLTRTPVSTSTVLGWFGNSTNGTATAPTNYTELNEFFTNPGGGTRTLQSVYDAGSAAQTATWSTTSTFSWAFLVETIELIEAVGTSSGSAAVTGVANIVAGTAGSSAGSASVSGLANSVTGVVGSASGIAIVAGLANAVFRTVGSASCLATVTGFTFVEVPVPPRSFTIRRSDSADEEHVRRSHGGGPGRSHSARGGRSNRASAGRSYGSFRGR